MATVVGMLSRIYLSAAWEFDAELALPVMATQLLSPMLVGLILAGIFAATMSTADSLILSCSSALTHDLLPKKQESMTFIKLGTLAITFGALLLALFNEQSVFNPVILSWSVLASSFAPLLIILSVGGRPSQKVSVAAIASGFLVAIFWRHMDWHHFSYEGMPGILIGLLVLAPAWVNRPRKA